MNWLGGMTRVTQKARGSQEQVAYFQLSVLNEIFGAH